MHRAPVWHVAMATQASSVPFSAGAWKKAANTLKNYNALAKPGTKMGEGVNSGMCVRSKGQTEWHHIMFFLPHHNKQVFPT